MKLFSWRPIALAALASLTIACGSSTVSTARVANTQAALSAAREGGAEQHPSSAYHLELARKQMRQAQTFIENEDTEKARRALDRAQLDAEVSLQKARSAQARERAQKALERVEQLRGNTDTSSAAISSRVGS
ncbi:MAG: DUF4398 domain-containing protein [Myxococcota bacterium]